MMATQKILAPEPGTKFLLHNVEYVVVPWEASRDGYKTKVVAIKPGCKDHSDWCLGMDLDAWRGHLERGTIVTYEGERPPPVEVKVDHEQPDEPELAE